MAIAVVIAVRQRKYAKKSNKKRVSILRQKLPLLKHKTTMKKKLPLNELDALGYKCILLRCAHAEHNRRRGKLLRRCVLPRATKQ